MVVNNGLSLNVEKDWKFYDMDSLGKILKGNVYRLVYYIANIKVADKWKYY